jgi:hypothetical protein
MILLVMVALSYNISKSTLFQQFSLQAEYLIDGRLEVDIYEFELHDTSYSTYTEQYYWPLGILPAVILIPFVWIKDLIGIPGIFSQVWLQIPITMATFVLAYRLALKYRFSFRDSLILAIAFCFGSIFCIASLNPYSWYYAQGVAVCLLLFAVYEYHHQKRYWVIGVVMALLLQTRYMSALCLGFFVLEIIFNSKNNLAGKLRNLTILIFPVLLSFSFLLYLNYIRFGDIFDTGYQYANVGASFLLETREQMGYFNLAFIPRNFYYYFIKFLQPVVDPITQHFVSPFFTVDEAGLGFFFVSPIFANIVLNLKFSRETVNYWLISMAILLILLAHYTTGYTTYGPRYMLDFFPLLYILLLRSFKDNRLKPIHCFIIFASAFLNLLLINGIFLN